MYEIPIRNSRDTTIKNNTIEFTFNSELDFLNNAHTFKKQLSLINALDIYSEDVNIDTNIYKIRLKFNDTFKFQDMFDQYDFSDNRFFGKLYHNKMFIDKMLIEKIKELKL